MTNIVCLKWGTKYSSDYVNKLYRACVRNTTIPFNFYCLTEDGKGIDPAVKVLPLPHGGLDGWWNKIYLFSKELPITGRIFYVDLDTLITGNIDHMLMWNKGFVVLRDFFYGIAKGVDAKSVGSGLMSYEAGEYDAMWQKFIKDPKKIVQSVKPHGDQRYIQQEVRSFIYWQDICDEQVVSFKVHCGKGLPEEACVICYHGKPSIPESFKQRTKVPHFDIPPQKWVEDHWV